MFSADELWPTGGSDDADLHMLESRACELARTIATERVRLCVCLGMIAEGELFRAIGFANFKQYLRAQRIPVAYQTAQQYSQIGRAIIRNIDLLRRIGFSERHGINKLRYVQVAIGRCVSEQELAKHLLDDSFRDFRAFARAEQSPGRPAGGCADLEEDRWVRLYLDDDTIVARLRGGSEHDVAWLNPDAFGSRDRLQVAAERIVRALQGES